ncbi:unnamed protein product [Pleuronectes platessa]|uniref:Uncharacterized protein n=1 Tax=Pleuronectes platessa TaxID=8262 RepID=A0A9N7V626_PLEPL|nr:unnamed protein product [Pleuronectes platessa]
MDGDQKSFIRMMDSDGRVLMDDQDIALHGRKKPNRVVSGSCPFILLSVTFRIPLGAVFGRISTQHPITLPPHTTISRSCKGSCTEEWAGRSGGDGGPPPPASAKVESFCLAEVPISNNIHAQRRRFQSRLSAYENEGLRARRCGGNVDAGHKGQ